MAKAYSKPIDITHIPEMLRIAEEVRSKNEPRVLRWDEGDEVVMMPLVAKRRPKRTPTKADYGVFLSAAGSWKGLIDAKTFKKQIKSSRSSDRASVNL